jgi:uncharacterized membrane protein YciS (DUF1049 family)
MGLVVRLVKNSNQNVVFGLEIAEGKRKISQTVTVSHILLIIGYTVTSTFYFNIRFDFDYTFTQGLKIYSA